MATPLVERLDPGVDVGGADEGLTHPDVVEGRLGGVELDPVDRPRARGVDVGELPAGLGGDDRLGLGVVDDVHLTGLQRRPAGGRVGQEAPLDALQVRGAVVLGLRAGRGVVLVALEDDVLLGHPLRDDEGPRADGCGAVLVHAPRDAGRGLHRGPLRGQRLQQRGVRLGEVEAHVGGVDRLDLRDLLHREPAGGRGGVRVLEVLDVDLDRLGVHRGAVGEGDALGEGEVPGQAVVADLPVGGQPGLDRAVGVAADERLEVLGADERLGVVAAHVRVQAGGLGVARWRRRGCRPRRARPHRRHHRRRRCRPRGRGSAPPRSPPGGCHVGWASRTTGQWPWRYAPSLELLVGVQQ